MGEHIDMIGRQLVGSLEGHIDLPVLVRIQARLKGQRLGEDGAEFLVGELGHFVLIDVLRNILERILRSPRTTGHSSDSDTTSYSADRTGKKALLLNAITDYHDFLQHRFILPQNHLHPR